MNSATVRPARTRVVVFTTLAVTVIAIGVTLLLAFGHRETPTTSMFPTAAPAKISRAQMMAEYAKIAPDDSSATPDTMDSLAAKVCSILESGKTTDAVITVLTGNYATDATRVAQLLVSYQCPAYLKEFK